MTQLLTKSKALPLLLLSLCLPLSGAGTDEPAKDISSEAAPAEEEEAVYITHVLFLSEPRKSSAAAVKKWAVKALAAEPELAGSVKIEGGEGSYDLLVSGLTIGVEFTTAPWLEDQVQLIHETRDLRLREMLRNTTSAVVLSLEDNFDKDEDSRAEAEDLVLRLLAGFVEADTLAIYDDATGDFNYIDQEVLAALAGDDPLSAFEVEVLPPAVQIDRNDPAIQAAIHEARRRWPEFARSFRLTGMDDGPFLVKAEFRDGDEREFMWCEITELRGGDISAILKNDPARVKNVALDDVVKVKLSRIVDWIYPSEDGERIGGFTIEAAHQSAKNQPGK